MARIRNIKPEFFTSESVSALPLRARLTWIGLWTHCDNHGRTRDNLRLIKAAVWPLDEVSLRDIEEDLATLAAQGRIVRYQAGDKWYLEVTNWSEHQYGAGKGPAKYPPNPVDNPPQVAETAGPPADPQKSRQSLDGPRTNLFKPGGIQGSGVRGQGGGTRESANPDQDPPPPRCPKHLETPTEQPCRPCGDARKTRDDWYAEQPQRQAAQRSAQARQAAEHRATATATCDLCDDDGYRGGRV